MCGRENWPTALGERSEPCAATVQKLDSEGVRSAGLFSATSVEETSKEPTFYVGCKEQGKACMPKAAVQNSGFRHVPDQIVTAWVKAGLKDDQFAGCTRAAVRIVHIRPV